MKKLEQASLANISGGISDANCAIAGVIATGLLFIPGAGLLGSAAMWGAIALSDCDLV
jgi:hypothetical protein